MAEAVWRYPPSSFSPHQGFSKNSFHPSGCMVNGFHIKCYGMKDKESIFQLPFIAEGGKKFSAERFSVLSRTIYRSPQNEMKHC